MLVPPKVNDPPCIQNITGLSAAPGGAPLMMPSLPVPLLRLLPPLRLASAPGPGGSASGSGAQTLRKRQASDILSNWIEARRSMTGALTQSSPNARAS